MGNIMNDNSNKFKLMYDDFLVEGMLAPWEKSPMWRLFVAQRAMLAPEDPRPKFFKDDYINNMTSCMNALRDRFIGRRNELHKYDTTYTAFRIFNNSNVYGGLRWQIEGYILAGATDEQLIERYPYEGGIEVFEQYRKIFFDINEYKDNKRLILNTVLCVAYENHTEASKSDLLWKRFAMMADVEEFDRFLEIRFGEMDVHMKEKLREIQARDLMLESANLTMKSKLINERSLMTLSLAQNIMHIPQSTTSDIEKAALHEKVGKIAERMNLTLISSESKPPDNAAAIRKVSKIHHIQKAASSKRLKEAKKRYQEVD